MSEYPIPEDLIDTLKRVTAPIDCGGGAGYLEGYEAVELIERIARLGQEKRDDELAFNHAQNVVGRLEEQNKALEEALRIACLDAWPDNPHWPDLYLKKARSNIDVAARAALQQAKEIK